MIRSRLTPETARQLYVYENFLGFLDSFKAVSARLKGPDDYELITYNMIRDLAAQGVVHAEVYVSFGIIYYWKQDEVEPYVEAIERGRVRGEKDFGTTVSWLIDAVRHFGAEEAAKVFRKAAELRTQYPSIVGIGIGGDETRGSADLFRESYAEAQAAGLRLTAHAGETMGPESIWAAINIGAERVGHALSAQNDAELLEVLAQKQIPLELNVTSNIRTGCCKSFRRASGEDVLRVRADGDDQLGRPADVWQQPAGGVCPGAGAVRVLAGTDAGAGGKFGGGEFSAAGAEAGAAATGRAVWMVKPGGYPPIARA